MEFWSSKSTKYDNKYVGIFLPFHADVQKSARKGQINDSVEQLLSYPFPEIGEITMQIIEKALEGLQKLTFCIFEKLVKCLYICCGILMI